MYLPLHNVSGKKRYFIRIRVSKLGFFTVSLPLVAFVTCVLMTMYKDFEKANNTHCKVPNIFPSISASIGNYEPQNIIWKTAIYIHAPIRFFIIYLRWNYYKSVVRENCIFVVKLAILLNVIENFALLGLTHWTSSANYPYHEVSFKTFIGTSIFYMLLICIILTRYRRRPNITSLEMQSVKLKWRAFFVNISSFTLAAYFFLRHNRLCEAYVYCVTIFIHLTPKLFN
ncbi:post-GPI attachment to proteins factor 2 isoform X2 [Galleria mellonella]|uniref:Post-GPI attachment to proteins factor 2 isoform X2 n=1 Tax=Galleria mellonella TaxID=7137 RepID=A0ABM3MXS2_GALME|nr:post-GPI attachment to proteins factor 2 isoform X2 [Galleria mellonella]